MKPHQILGLAAMAALVGPPPDVDALRVDRPRSPDRARPQDPHAAERAKHRKARTFVAEDGNTYPAGPCGYVPKSAQLDPARSRVR